MGWQDAFNLLAGASGFVLAWLLKTLWSAVDHLRRDISNLERQLAETYVRRDDHNQTLERIERKLDRLFEKLDQKQDKV